MARSPLNLNLQMTNRMVWRKLLENRTWLVALGLTLAVCAIFLVPHPWSDGIFFGAVVASIVLALFRLEQVWLSFLLVFPLVNLSEGLFGNFWVTISRTMVLGLSLVVLLRYRDSAILRSLVHSNGFRLFALFVVVNLIAAVRVFQPYVFFFTLTYLEPLLFFALSYVIVRRNPENLPRLLSAILISGAIVVVVGFYEIATQQSVAVWLNSNLTGVRDIYMHKSNSDRFGLGGRILTLVGQPVFAGLYLALLPFVGFFYFEEYKRARWAAVLFGAACGFLVLATGTRGGIVAFAAGVVTLGLVGLRQWKHRLIAFLLIIGLAGLLLLALPNLRTYLISSAEIDSGSAAARNVVARIALTRELLRYFQNNWLLGYGPGLVQRQAQLGIIPTAEGIDTLGGMENQYAAILVDGGILAGAAYLLFMCGVVWDAVRMLRHARWRRMGVTLLALFAAYFVFAGTELAVIPAANLVLMAVYGAFMAAFETAPITSETRPTMQPEVSPA